MTQRGDVLRGVEQQIFTLVALPGQPVSASALAGPRHLFRAVEVLVHAGYPEPLIGLDGDGDVQAQWTLDDVVVTLVVDDRGSGWVWARDADATELLYAEWEPSDQRPAAWSAAAALLERVRSRQDA